MWSYGNDRLCAAAPEMVIQCGNCVVHRGEDGGDSLGRELSVGDECEHPGDERAGPSGVRFTLDTAELRRLVT